MSHRKIRLVQWPLLATILMSLTSPLAAQRITGQIRGKVSDPSLAGLSGVTIELTSGNIIGTRTTISTVRGHYRFITLPPGFYHLTFRHPDFKTEEFRHVHVAVGTTTRKNVTLNLAAMADTVNVTAEVSRADGLPPSDERLVRLNASKRAQSQEEAPISIAGFDAPAFEYRTMYDLSDLADFTPNLEFATTAGAGMSSSATVFIRGLGQTDTLTSQSEPGVGIYLDGVYVSRSQGAVLDLVDIEVVEVLRGPQGTLFGKNTLGGAISIVTRKPGSDLAGHVELTAGNFDRLNGSARVSGGVSPTLFGSLSMASTNATGFTRSLATGKDFNDDNTDSARAAWRWQASEAVTADWSGDVSRQRERGPNLAPIDVDGRAILLYPYNNIRILAGWQPYDERWVTGDLQTSYSTFPSVAESDILGTSLSVHGLLGTNLSVRSIASYRQLDQSESLDLDGSPADLISSAVDVDQQQWSEEIWLSGLSSSGRLTWVLGTFYLKERSRVQHFSMPYGDFFEALESLPGPVATLSGELCDPPDGDRCFGGAGNPRNRDHVFASLNETIIREMSTQNYALFGEGTFDFSEKLSLTAGLRYSHEKKEFVQDRSSRFSFVEDTWGSVTTRFNLVFRAKPDVMLYWTAANGFKSSRIDDGPLASDPEWVWSYEAGIKTHFFSHRLRAHASFFLNDYTDLQLFSGLFSQTSLNAGEAEIKGFEVGLQARLSDHFRIEAGVGHIDAKYTNPEGHLLFGSPVGFRIPLSGELPRAPEWNFVFSPEYILHLWKGGAVVLHADYTYKTELFYDLGNTVAQEAYGLINARASFILPSGAWEAYAYGTNLADQEYKEHGQSIRDLGTSVAVAGRPREWGVGLKYRF